MKTLAAIVLATLLLPSPDPDLRDRKPGPGVLVASVGDAVVVADPTTGAVRRFATGPVAWLFPAPGGRLFAPDLVAGRTTVIDLRAPAVAEELDGVSMPWFGEQPDRYLAVSGQLLLMSYPDRAVLASVPVQIERPWQVELAAEDTYAMVLERDPAGGPTAMTIADLVERRLVSRRPTGGEVVHFAVLPGGLLAFADVTARRVRLVQASTLETVVQIDPGGRPADVVVVDDGEELLTAAATPSGACRVTRWRLRSGKHGVEAVLKKATSLPAAPVRMAVSPDGQRLAVATADGELYLRDASSLAAVATIDLGGAPRDLHWCDPGRTGPALPEWSDRAPSDELDDRRLGGSR